MTLNSERVGIDHCVDIIEQYLIIKGFITESQIKKDRHSDKGLKLVQ